MANQANPAVKLGVSTALCPSSTPTAISKSTPIETLSSDTQASTFLSHSRLTFPSHSPSTSSSHSRSTLPSPSLDDLNEELCGLVLQLLMGHRNASTHPTYERVIWYRCRRVCALWVRVLPRSHQLRCQRGQEVLLV